MIADAGREEARKAKCVLCRTKKKGRTGARPHLVEWNSLLPESPRRDLC